MQRASLNTAMSNALIADYDPRCTQSVDSLEEYAEAKRTLNLLGEDPSQICAFQVFLNLLYNRVIPGSSIITSFHARRQSKHERQDNGR